MSSTISHSFLSPGSLAAVVMASFTPASAFPPAPFHTIYGLVRDENGRALRVDGARVVFYRNGVEFLSETIRGGSQPDQNYQIRLRMDMLRAGTQSYTSLANSTGTPFTLGVVLHDVVYYPIEMSTPRAVGKPGERVRLDLTLGVDADGDGIPDAWEQSQLYAGGILPGEDGWDLSLIDRDGDFDGDGVSNWDEYLAGTFATDPTDYLSLQITAKFPQSVRLGFFAVYGKTYSLETSTDLQTWTAAPFYSANPVGDGSGDPGDGEPPPDDDTVFEDEEPPSTGGEEIDDEEENPVEPEAPEYPGDFHDPAAPPAPRSALLSETTGIVHIYALADPGTGTFYRLKVR